MSTEQPDWLSEREAAEHLPISHRTLARYREDGKGPPYWNGPDDSGPIRYKKSDVIEWREQCMNDENSRSTRATL